MSLALLFPGQGTQHPDMLPWLAAEAAARTSLDALASCIGADWRDRMGNRGWAAANKVAQPLIVGLEAAAWACLAPRLPRPAVVAGYSVGELAAFHAAGVFDPAAVQDLAVRRAEAMQRSVAGRATRLVALRLPAAASLQACCARHGLHVAIRLGPGRAIVGGLASDLDDAMRDPLSAAGEWTDIGVRIASHTPWMHAAAREFAQAIGAVSPMRAQATVVCNDGARASRDPGVLAGCLARQLECTVPWDDCMAAVAERGVRCVLELGPGASLSALWRQAYPHIPARSADEFRSADAVVDWVKKTLA